MSQGEESVVAGAGNLVKAEAMYHSQTMAMNHNHPYILLPKVLLLVEPSSKRMQECECCLHRVVGECTMWKLLVSFTFKWCFLLGFEHLLLRSVDSHTGENLPCLSRLFKLGLLISAHILLFGLETAQCYFVFFGQEFFLVYSHTKERECSDKIKSVPQLA